MAIDAHALVVASDVNGRLCTSAERGDVSNMQRLIAEGASVNAMVRRMYMDTTPLVCAAQEGHTAAVAFLLGVGAHVNLENGHGGTPLYVAASRDRVAVMEALLSAGANVHQSDRSGYTPLHRAAANGRAGAVKLLLDAGARVDVRCHGKLPADDVCTNFWASAPKDKDGVTALLTAAVPWSRRRPLAIGCYGEVAWE
jgi:ankyrin repeat protein